MAVTKIIEVVGSSPESSDGAVKAALDDARQSLRNIKAVDVVSTGPARREPRRVARAGADLLPGRARQRVAPIDTAQTAPLGGVESLLDEGRASARSRSSSRSPTRTSTASTTR